MRIISRRAGLIARTAGRPGWRRFNTNAFDDRSRVAAFLARSDEASFRDLYRVHTPALYRLARRILGGGSAEAEEVVQTAWIRAVEGLRSFRWESSLRTWLAGITVNGCREALRRRAKERAVSGPEAGGGAGSADRQGALAIDLERGVGRLPDGYREVLILHDVEGYTHEEIGALLGIETGTSKSQLSRARRALASLLSGAVRPDAGKERRS